MFVLSQLLQPYIDYAGDDKLVVVYTGYLLQDCLLFVPAQS